jgi:hypothetical protein
MATSDLKRMLDDWVMAWSSAEHNDPERGLALIMAAEHIAARLIARNLI